MRLFKHPFSGYYYIEYQRGHARSLKTKNKLLAMELFKEALRNKQYAAVGSKPPETRTIEQFSVEYILSRKGTIRPNTQRIDQESFNKLMAFLKPAMDIDEITQKQMEDFRAHLLNDRNLLPSTVNICWRSLRAAFNKARDWGYIPVSPMAKLKVIREKDVTPRALTPQEVDKLLDGIDDPEFLRYALCCLYSGGRREAVAKLDWSDIKKHGDHYTINMRHTKGQTLTIPLPERLKAVLWPHRKSGPVFPYYARNFREASRHFRKFADKAGLDDVKLHDLRHTTGTFLILKGVPVRIVQRILGHSKLEMTEKYTKIAAQYLKGAADVLDFKHKQI